jgi:hypothetical protein
MFFVLNDFRTAIFERIYQVFMKKSLKQEINTQTSLIDFKSNLQKYVSTSFADLKIILNSYDK